MLSSIREGQADLQENMEETKERTNCSFSIKETCGKGRPKVEKRIQKKSRDSYREVKREDPGQKSLLRAEERGRHNGKKKPLDGGRTSSVRLNTKATRVVRCRDRKSALKGGGGRSGKKGKIGRRSFCAWNTSLKDWKAPILLRRQVTVGGRGKAFKRKSRVRGCRDRKSTMHGKGKMPHHEEHRETRGKSFVGGKVFLDGRQNSC